MSNYRPAGVALALLFMVLFLAALGVRFWASGKAAETVGPDHLAADSEQVYVHANGELVVLSRAGELRARHATSGIMGSDQLIDLRVLPDGKLLLARRMPAGFYSCETKPWYCTELALPVAGKLRDQYKVFPDPNARRLLIADYASAELWSQPLTGEAPEALLADKELRGPNDLALDRAGRLWVADSRGHRLVVFEASANGAWQKRATHTARTRHAREGRDWPMMLAEAPDGHWWVAQPTPTGRRADLLLYHPEEGAVARVEMPGGASPTDVASIGDAMLVTDMDNFRVYQVDVASHAVSEFGDAQFRAGMQSAAERKAAYERWVDATLYAMIAFGVLMLLAAVWATPREKRWSKPQGAAPLAPSSAPAPVLGRVHWLKRNPKTERMFRWIAPIAWSVVIIMFGTFGAFYLMVLSEPPEQRAALAELANQLLGMALLSLGLPMLAGRSVRSMQHRLGTDGRTLYVKLADGRQLSLAPEQIAYDARKIVYRNLVFAVHNAQKQSLYETGEIETFVAPLLARAKKLRLQEMVRYQLAHREPLLIGSLAYGAVGLVVVIASGLWRLFLRGFL